MRADDTKPEYPPIPPHIARRIGLIVAPAIRKTANKSTVPLTKAA